MAPRATKSHTDRLKDVCLICCGKGNRQISSCQKAYDIVKSVLENFEDVQHYLPSGICNSCRIVKFSTDNLSTKYKEWINILSKLPPSTRSSPDCACFVCIVSKSASKSYGKSLSKGGRPAKVSDSSREKTPPPSTSRATKVKEFMETWSPKSRMMACNETIREQKANKLTKSPIKLPNLSGGPKMPIVFGTKSLKEVENKAKKSSQIPKETMINIMNEGNRSKNDIKKIARKLRKELGRGIIESGLDQALLESKVLEEFFTVKSVKMLVKNNKAKRL